MKRNGLVARTVAMAAAVIYVVELFAGAGGATTSVVKAAGRMNLDVELVAVNHWQTAVDTHAANYPNFVHYCQLVGKLSPREAVPGCRVHLLVAGPECTNHSNAKGGKPRDNQSRCSAMDILWWLCDLDVRNLLIENVREWQDWGPMRQKRDADGNLVFIKKKIGEDANGKALYEVTDEPHMEPIPERKKEYFKLFLRQLTRLGYEYEYKMICAADYGDATTRRRLALLAWKGGGAPSWPVPTHRPRKDVHHFPDAKPWRAVREVLDLTLPTRSIYEREPGDELAENTMRRIFTGFYKNAGLPFIVPNFGEREGQTPRSHSVYDPAPTVTSHGAGLLVEPWLVVERNNCDSCSIDEPAPTVTAGGNHFWVAAASCIMANRTHNVCTGLDEPQPTQCTGNNLYLVHPQVMPWLVNMKGRSIGSALEEPAPTQTTNAHQYLAEPCLYHVGHTTEGHERRVLSLDAPMPTATATGDFGVIQPKLETFLTGFTQTGSNGAKDRPVSEPMPTQTTKQEHLICEPCIVGAGGPTGSGRPQPTSEPLGTILTENHRALVLPHIYKANNNPDGTPNPGSTLDAPLPTIVSQWNNLGLVDPVIVRYNEGDNRVQSTKDPLSTIDTGNRFALAQFILQYNGNGENVWEIVDPLKTCTTKDRFALVELVFVPGAPEGVYRGQIVGWIDIRTRMLVEKELAGAHSFPEGYLFTGTRKDRVAQIGNSWPTEAFAALVVALLSRPGGLEHTKGWTRAGSEIRIPIAEAIDLMNLTEKATWGTLWDAAGEHLVMGGPTKRKRAASGRRRIAVTSAQEAMLV